MIRTAAITFGLWCASFSAWLAIREIRWIYWRDRCRRTEVERDHFEREASWWKAQAVAQQQDNGDLAEKVHLARRAGVL